MSNFEGLDVDAKIIASVKRAQIKTFEAALSLSDQELERSTKLSYKDVQTLKTAVAKALPKLPVVTALDLLKGNCPDVLKLKKLTTGNDVIDEALRGGILSHGITEISGESASGKTQFCLQISLTVQLPENLGGLNGGVAYICTEDAFPNKRLYQMIEYFNKKTENIEVFKSKVKFGDNIFIEHVSDVDGLVNCTEKKLPLLMAQHTIKLVIVDSVAALFRCEYDSSEMIKRSKDMNSLAASLHKLSHQNNIPVVCVNQVTGTMDNTERKHIPSLGLSWSNQVTCRIMLSRTEQQMMLPRQFINNVVIGGFETSIRKLEVMFAPHLLSVTLPFVIDQEGIKAFV